MIENTKRFGALDDRLIGVLVEHEGLKRNAYEDSLGFLTIGIGRLIDSRKGGGLSADECFYLLRNDLSSLHASLEKYDWFLKCNDVRQGVIIEMAFNLGLKGLMGFKKTIDLIEQFQYAAAAKEMADSRWAKQIGPKRLENMQLRMASGRYVIYEGRGC